MGNYCPESMTYPYFLLKVVSFRNSCNKGVGRGAFIFAGVLCFVKGGNNIQFGVVWL